MINWPKDIKYIISCDLETTGVDVHGCSWITGSFGKLDANTLETIEELEVRSRPDHWDEEARYIHKISKKTALTFPNRKESLDKIIDFLPPKNEFAFSCHASSSHKSANLGWQVVNYHFDLAVLKWDFFNQDRYFDFYKYFKEENVISTTSICRDFYEHPKSFLLPDSCAALGMPMSGEHHEARFDRLAHESILKRYKQDESGLFTKRKRSPKLDTGILEIQGYQGLEK